MLKIGDYNELEIVKEVDFGVYLDSEEGEILLPKKYVPKNAKIGDTLRVFVYKDSEDRTIATTLTPKAKVGEFAFLKVNDVNRNGAFLDWGLEKDLLVPYREQNVKLQIDRWYVVKVYFDEVTKRITASTKINKHVEKEPVDIKEEQEVDLLVYRFNDYGAEVIINNKYLGLVYKDDIYEDIRVGETLKGYILKIREDNKIDVTLRRYGYKGVDDARDTLLQKLDEMGGFLNFTDKSPVEVIERELHMSKKSFKKALGGLYKDRIVEITENGIRLKK